MTRLSTGKGFENFQWWDTGFLIFSGNERGHAPLSTVRVVNDHDKKKNLNQGHLRSYLLDIQKLEAKTSFCLNLCQDLKKRPEIDRDDLILFIS